jgi:hypothetical protein
VNWNQLQVINNVNYLKLDKLEDEDGVRRLESIGLIAQCLRDGSGGAIPHLDKLEA